MGTTYNAKVFFGAWVPASDSFASILADYHDRAGGTPAETDIEGVVIDIAGDNWNMIYTIEAEGSARSFERGDDIETPTLLSEDPKWRPAIMAFLEKHGDTHFNVGWHFAASAF